MKKPSKAIYLLEVDSKKDLTSELSLFVSSKAKCGVIVVKLKGVNYESKR